MKNFIKIQLMIFALLANQITCLADGNVGLKVNGESTSYNDIYISDGYTMIEGEALANILSTYIECSPDSNKVTVNKYNYGGFSIYIKDSIILKETGELLHLTHSAEVTDGKVYLPLRCVCELFGATVDWNEDESTVEINTNKDIEVVKDVLILQLPVNTIKAGRFNDYQCFNKGEQFYVCPRISRHRSCGDLKEDVRKYGYMTDNNEYMKFNNIECIKLRPGTKLETYLIKTPGNILIELNFSIFSDETDEEYIDSIVKTARACEPEGEAYYEEPISDEVTVADIVYED